MLTQSQTQALDHSRHTCVTANAGSGKTMVLVERYLKILLGGTASVGEIVAITFTDKAASELKRKIAVSVSRRLKETADLPTRRLLENARDQLSSALICTIHAFCSRILREYPVEAGVDASFTVLEVIDQEMLLQESLRETFQNILSDRADRTLRDEVFELVRLIGKPAVKGIASALCHRREQVERLVSGDGLYAQSDEQVLAFWHSLLSERLQKELIGSGVDEDLLRVAEGAKGKDALAVRAGVRRFVATQELGMRQQEFLHLMESMLTQKGTLLKSLTGAAEIDPSIVKRLSDRRKLIEPLVAVLFGEQPNVQHVVLLRSTRTLLKIYQQTIERYETTKLESGQLDFDDLQLRTKNLLTREPVRSRLAHRYKFIMVDEYQDTNTLQYEILLPLVSNLATGNLFIVGDPKQSIYGFRNADVSVFEKTRMDIQEASGLWGTVVLGESFRPLRDVAALVNTVFTPLMKKSEGVHASYEVGYEPLVKARSNKASGRVELLLREEEEEGRSSLSEGEMIARRVLSLHASKSMVCDKDEKEHEIQFRDIAILLRSRNLLEEIEHALVRHHIPYLVTAGAGYFQTQTMYDFYNYFRFLLNTGDDVALTGVLRSPLYAVSDAELFDAAGENRKGSLWQHLRSDRSPAKEFPALRRALTMLDEDVLVGLRLTVTELIQRIVQRTGYIGITAGIPRGDQAMANLGKLHRLAETFEGRGFSNLYDFVKRLSRLIEEEEQEGQGAIDIQRDAVQIMTIHAAKGLEFPVVILPGLESTFQYDREPFIDDHLGIGFETSNESEEMPAITSFLKLRSRSKSLAEEMRVFYVACTRARDMLILSGLLDSTETKAQSYMRWLRNGLGIDDIPSGKIFEYSVVTPCLNGESGLANEAHTLSIHILRADDLARALSVESPPIVLKELGDIRIESIAAQPTGEIYSASKLRTYRECPAKYYLRYVLGLPEVSVGKDPDRETDEDDDEHLTSQERGSLLHLVMEKIDSIDGSDSAIESLVRTTVAAIPLVQTDLVSIINEMTETVRSILQSEFWRSISKGTEVKTEYAITTLLGEDFLTGKLDRLFKNESGDWHILDYKTDSINADEVSALGDSYLNQLGFYAFVLHKTTGAGSISGTLLFTNHLNKPISKIYMAAEFATIETEIRDVVGRINSHDFNKLEKCCLHCPFFPQGCPAFSHSIHSLIGNA
ncbi:MAG: UvrD-helicase domain-containing protein [Bacteroidota bacterium]